MSSLLALQARKLELPEAAVEAEEEGGSADGEEEEAPASPVKRDFTTSTKARGLWRGHPSPLRSLALAARRRHPPLAPSPPQESKMVAGGYREDWIQFTWLAAGAAHRPPAPAASLAPLQPRVAHATASLLAGAAVFSALCMLFVYLGTPPSEEEAREANGSGST